MSDVNFTLPLTGYPSVPQEIFGSPREGVPTDLPEANFQPSQPRYPQKEEEELSRPEYPTTDREGMEKAVKELNAIVDGMVNRSLRFDIYDGTDQLYVQVVDRRSNQVLRIMPPEELMALRHRIRSAVGVILDTEI